MLERDVEQAPTIPAAADGGRDTAPRAASTLTDERVLASVGALILAIIFCYPLVLNLATPAMFNDWDFSMQLQWTAYDSIVHFHQLPLWNPFKCGGMPLFGNPQSHFLTPWFILTLLFGPIIGLHLEVIIAFITAWLGTYVLGRILALRPLAAAGAACAFAASSWLNLHAAEGHMVFLPIAYTPWIIALAIMGSAPGKTAAAIAAGALLALTFFEGGGYPPVFIGLMLSVVMLAMCLTRLSLRPAWALIIVGVFAAGFAAIKVLPAYALISAAPRPTESAYSNTWTVIGTALFSRNQDHMRFSPNYWGFHESGAYLGLFTIPALIGLCRPRRALPWLAAIIVIVELARGDIGPNSLWVYLHQLPVGSSMRLPSRFLMMATLAVGVLAGLGFDAMLSRWRILSAIAMALLAAALIDNFLVVTSNLHYALGNQVEPDPVQQTFRQYRLDGWAGNMYRVTRQNMGILHCYEYTDWTTSAASADEPGYRGEQYMKGAGSVRPLEWSPNVLRFEVDTPAPSALVINQNYDPSWRVTSGAGNVYSEGDLIGVRVPAGKTRITLRYVSIPAIVGAIISLFTMCVTVIVIRYDRARRQLREVRTPIHPIEIV